MEATLTHAATSSFFCNGYVGPTNDYGQPHGIGEMHYSDGGVYVGNFVNGMRHGHGKYISVDGEGYEGLFEYDKITGDGFYYGIDDEDKCSCSSAGRVIWDKAWRLPASLLCFGLALLSGWLLISFMSGDSDVTMRAGALLAPFVFAWYGLKMLVSFFRHLC